MTRARRASDWDKDLAAARAAEAELAGILAVDARLVDFADHTADFDRLDFSFSYRGLRVTLDLKEKRQTYSAQYRAMWPDVAPEDLFIIDETVYRRIVWQGGGGYLAVHDHPGGRWVTFGPWELTLGPRLRYQRWGQRAGPEFAKGKLLLDLSAGAHQAPEFRVDDLLGVIERSIRGRDAVDAVAAAHPLPQIR
ncbi:MAG: hypothetical protein ACRDJI_06235 [Actinomycetota bacterium]